MGYESTREGEKEVRVLCACVRARTREGEFGGEERRKRKKRGNRLKQRMSQ